MRAVSSQSPSPSRCNSSFRIPNRRSDPAFDSSKDSDVRLTQVRPISKIALAFAFLCFTGLTLGSLTKEAPTQFAWTSLSAGNPCEPVSTQFKGTLSDQASPEQRISSESYAASSRDVFGSPNLFFNFRLPAQDSLFAFRSTDVPIRLRQRPPPLL